LLTTQDVAELLKVHVSTVRRWSIKRMLPSYRFGPKGDRRYRDEDIMRFLNSHRAEREGGDG
jgi:excisionase family DNA binding protein